MKTDQFASVTKRAAAAVLACLLLFVAGADGQMAQSNFKGRRKPGVRVISTGLALALTQQVGEVRQRFETNRRALRTVPGPGGKMAYPLQEVAGLIDRTGEDLDQAIQQVGEPGLDGLRAWSDEKLRRIKEGLPAPSGRTASIPRAVAVVASLKWLPLPEVLAAKAVAPKQETIDAEKADGILDQVGAVVERIFFLASNDDLEVKIWVGSTPAAKVKFSFWPQSKAKGTPAAPLIIRTNNKKDQVLRGLYAYRASWTKGAMTELVEFPNPASASAAQAENEQLDLVNGTSFFCCRFKEHYCHHVDTEKDCRP